MLYLVNVPQSQACHVHFKNSKSLFLNFWDNLLKSLNTTGDEI